MSAAAVVPPWRQLEIAELTFRHPRARLPRPTLERVALRLQRRRRYALLGASGAGKSTLLRILAGLDVPVCISLQIDGPAGCGGLQWHAGGESRSA